MAQKRLHRDTKKNMIIYIKTEVRYLEYNCDKAWSFK